MPEVNLLAALSEYWPLLAAMIGGIVSIITFLWRIKISMLVNHTCIGRVEGQIKSVDEKIDALGEKIDKHMDKSDRAFERLVKVEQKVKDKLGNVE